MLRRHAIATLFAAAARAADRLAPAFQDAHGSAVLVDMATRRFIAVHNCGDRGDASRADR